MPITKIQSEADFDELLGDTNFKYVPLLPESLRRVAAYYEYARESAELIEVVTALRKSRIFKTGGKKRGVNPELMHRIATRREIYPIEALYILAECNDFPRKPFRDALQHAKVLKRPGLTIGLSGPGELPWRAVLSLRDDFSQRGLSEMQFYDHHSRGSSTLHAISIPWNYTDEQLADFFRKLIPRLRPPGSPEPKQPGRRGRTCGAGAVDMLNQLGAFRLKRAGWKFAPACKITRKLTPYTSAKGWQKAVNAVEERIHNLTKRPLFGYAKVGNCWNKTCKGLVPLSLFVGRSSGWLCKRANKPTNSRSSFFPAGLWPSGGAAVTKPLSAVNERDSSNQSGSTNGCSDTASLTSSPLRLRQEARRNDFPTPRRPFTR